MSCVDGPNVVTDGLVLHVDAPNIKSYSGSGNIWNDVSGNNTTGTLVNSPTYNGQSIVLNGTDQYVTFANTANLNFLGNSNYTLQAWVYPTAQPGVNTWKGIINKEKDSGSGRDGYNLYLNTTTGTTTQLVSVRYASGVFLGSATITLDASISINKWSFINVTFDGTYLKMYRNGILGATNTQTAGNITNTLNAFEIGTRNATAYCIAANIPQVSIYNRALSATEISQNFNATRSRYDI